MVVSDTPIAWDFQRWRRILASYRIDGRPIFDPTRNEDRAQIDQLVSWEDGLVPNQALDKVRYIEPCADILARTAGKLAVTDDNMGSEWLHFLGLE
jgi:spermidine synthase